MILSELLYFITNKFGKTGKTELNSLRNVIVDFYNDPDIVSVAKCQLLDDMAHLTYPTNCKQPHVPRRRQISDPRNRAQVEVDDIFKQLIFLDENKLSDQLPIYVSAKADENPAAKLCEGDLKFFYLYMDRLESRLQGLGSQLSGVTRDVRTLMGNSRPSSFQQPHVSHVLSSQSATMNGSEMHVVHDGSNDIHHAAAAESVNKAPKASKATLENPTPVHSQTRYWADESTDEMIDGPSWATAESRRTRNKRRRVANSPKQTTASADQSADERRSNHNHINHDNQRRQAQRAPLIVGRATSSGDHLTAVRPIFKKSVFCIDNVDPRLTCDELVSFVENLAVTVINCYQVKPRRRRNETEVTDRIAFRLCIKAADRDKLLDADKWPENICVCEWFHTKKEHKEEQQATAHTDPAMDADTAVGDQSNVDNHD